MTIAIEKVLRRLGWFTWGRGAWIHEDDLGDVCTTAEALQREGLCPMILDDLLSPHQRAQLDNLATAWASASCVSTERGVATMHVYADGNTDDDGLPVGEPVEVWRCDRDGNMLPQVVLRPAGRDALRARGVYVPELGDYAGPA